MDILHLTYLEEIKQYLLDNHNNAVGLAQSTNFKFGYLVEGRGNKKFDIVDSLLCKKVYKVGNSDFNVGVHGQAAELSCGRELSSVVPTQNQSTKRSAIITVGNYLKASAILRFTRDLLFVNVLILCGDIAQNPRPGAASRGVGLKVCHWNIQHLTDSKLEEIRVKLTNPNNGEDKPDILILTETFCSAKVPDSF
ncbi:hypothetical protein ACROYT_G015268 [Oculina patagonica]